MGFRCGGRGLVAVAPRGGYALRDGQACAVALHGAHVVAYCWLTDRPALVAEIDRVVVPAPEDVYLYDAFTVLAWRGCGLFRALLLRLVAFASAHGRARALIYATSRNLASCRAIEQAGFEKLGSVSRIELPGVRGVWLRHSRSPGSVVKLIGVPAARDTSARGRSSSRSAAID